MTIDALRAKSTRARRLKRPDIPIGEADANIFNCPACARPLAVGTSRCPACSTRLIDGVRATRAAVFIAIGFLVGGIVGAGLGGVVALAATAEPAAIVEPNTNATPSGAPLASAPVLAPDPTVPASALAALHQTTLLNQRIVIDAERLEAAVKAKTPSAVEIARVLRVLAASAGFGDRVAPDVADWSDGATLSEGLVEFYATIGTTARDGLSASVNNRSAYVKAGRSMLSVLGGLDDLDAEARVLAAWAQFALPPLEPTPAP
jgi:hypothetical protein